MITPDVGAASLGLTAGWLYWRWLSGPDWSRAVVAGVALGLAELAKFTWIVLFGVWPVLWLARRLWPARDSHRPPGAQSCFRLP